MTANDVVGMDIGGTFTDLVLWDGRQYRTAKVLSTPPKYAQGVLNGLDQLFFASGLKSPASLVHGTTSGLNAFLERRGARTALLTTEGFRDVYEIGRMNRTDMYNLFFRKPERPVPRHRVYEVPERIMADGTVRKPLDVEALMGIVEALRGSETSSVAICLIHAYKNPVHEQQIEKILRRQLPGISISVSHRVAPEWREYERTSTTVLNAYISPVMEGYLDALEEGLVARGFTGQLYIMQSNGGVMTATTARRQAVRTLMSGPVGGAVGSEMLARQLGKPNLICTDMGGTSFDVSLILEGESEVSTHTVLEGFPVLAPMVAIHSIGAGGGSIARVLDGGLRVGPISAGANPGPACYGLGGSEPTVTDANLLLGRIDPNYFLGGAMVIDREAAERAMSPLAQELNLDMYLLSEGILRVINAKMANAIRTITVSRGIDPRQFALVAFGGAGPMHAAFLAEELGIPRVIVPAMPGIFSAWGMLHTDIRQDLTRSYFETYSQIQLQEMTRAYRELEDEGRHILRAEGLVDEERIEFVRSADIRYIGQEYFLNLPITTQLEERAFRRLPADFHEAYERRYGHSTASEEIEIVNLRLQVIGRFRSQELPEADSRYDPLPDVERRQVFLDGEWQPCAVYPRSSLPPEFLFGGPAIVEEPSCTTVVPSSFEGQVDQYGNLILNRSKS